jgi:pimeloyl-ACP methyl ester carboxylesterase
VTPGSPPNLEQWPDSIGAVIDDLGIHEAVLVVFGGAISPAALFAATYPSRTTAFVALDVFADQMAARDDGMTTKGIYDASVAVWGTGQLQRWLNPDMPFNEEVRASWARHERLSASSSITPTM